MGRTLVLFLLSSALLGCAVTNESRVAQMFSDYSGSRPGAAVRVIRDGEVVLTGAYGLANLDTGEAVSADTNFRLASITKHMTALGIVMLAEQQRITLDTVMVQVFQDFPAYGDDITVEYLLQHRSGLLDYEPLVPEGATVQVRDADVLQMMTEQERGYFEPGSEYRYSNSGYAVLAMIIEEMANMPFQRYLKERIFEPSAMTRSVAFVDGANAVPHRALGYTVEGEAIVETDQSLYSAVLGDGGVYSSLQDLTRWDASGYGRDLVSAEAMDRILTPALETYGFGWRIDDFRGHRRIHHSGSTSGFRNVLVRFPDQALTIIILTNRAGPDVMPLAEQIAGLYLTPPG